MDSLGVSICKIMSSTNRDSFTASFLIWLPYISSSCLISLAGTSNTMLNRSGEITDSCVVPDVRVKAFSLSPL